jgi:citrate lyase subunit beta/citryl-CoA lyase
VPGSSARALAKLGSLPADAFILDLEDAVAPDAKSKARDTLSVFAAEAGERASSCAIRINALGTAWGRDDVRMVARSGVRALVLPKVGRASDVRALVSALESAGAPDALRVWCMIETPLGVLNAAEIAGSNARVETLVMGTSDLAKELRCAHTPDRTPLLASLSAGLLAARAEGRLALDGVYLDLHDLAGFERECMQGRELGFDGKTLIHPRTIETANRVFAPSDEELENARRVIEAFESARDEGRGVAVLDGRLVEELHVQEARRLLALAATIFDPR